MKMRGFTLMEMVVTIVITGIMMLGIGSYLRLGMSGYVEAVDRQRLQTQSQFIVEKMSREIRHAVPNSFHVPAGEAGNCLAFMPISYSGFYTDWGSDIHYIVANNNLGESLPSGLSLVINPTRWDDLTAGSSSRFEITNLNKTDDHFVLTGAANSLGAGSISHRHYIFDEDDLITYCFVNNRVERNKIAISDDVVLTDGVGASALNYSDTSLHRGSLVQVHLIMEQEGERSDYQQDVQVLNVP